MLRTKLALFEQNVNDKLLNEGSVVDLAYDKSARSSKALTGKDAATIARLLKNPNFPKNMTLDLSRNNLGDDGVNALKAAINSGHCKPGLKINLLKNDASLENVKELNALIAENDRVLIERSKIHEAAIGCLQFRLGFMHQAPFHHLSKDVITKIFEFAYPCTDGPSKNGEMKSKAFAKKIMSHMFFVPANNLPLASVETPSLDL